MQGGATGLQADLADLDLSILLEGAYGHALAGSHGHTLLAPEPLGTESHTHGLSIISLECEIAGVYTDDLAGEGKPFLHVRLGVGLIQTIIVPSLASTLGARQGAFTISAAPTDASGFVTGVLQEEQKLVLEREDVLVLTGAGNYVAIAVNMPGTGGEEIAIRPVDYLAVRGILEAEISSTEF